jgi:hypothetical protein
MLQFPWMRHFEVMPWPDRVFLPGYTMATGTPGPEDYRRALMNAFAVLQELGDLPMEEGLESALPQTGYLVSDTLGWQRGGPEGSRMESVHGFTVPLLRRGVPIGLVPLERHADQSFMDGFKILVLSYDAQKPLDPQMNLDLAEWVKRGGQLIFLGGQDAYNSVEEWWIRDGFSAPQEHLWEALGIWKRGQDLTAFAMDKEAPSSEAGLSNAERYWHSYSAGKGYLLLVRLPSAWFADSKDGGELAHMLFRMAYASSRSPGEPEEDPSPAGFSQRIGSIYASRMIQESKSPVPGFDLLDPDLRLDRGMHEGGISLTYAAPPGGAWLGPQHFRFAGPRAKSVTDTESLTQIELRSPDNTPATTRLDCLGAKAASVTAKAKGSGEAVEVRQEYDAASDSLLCIVPAGVKGAVLEVKWERK